MKSSFTSSMKRIASLTTHIGKPSRSLHAFTHIGKPSQTALKSKSELADEVASYYGQNANYAGLFGTNIHLGYFPHVDDASKRVLSFAESGTELTKHMMEVAGIDSNSNVIDFGCGAGGPIFDISQMADCKVLGVDVTSEFIEQATERFASQSDKVQYMTASILDLPDEIKAMPKFSHLFAVQSLCHCAPFIEDILREAHSVLEKDGVMVINDFVVAESGPTEESAAYFYKRLHFDHLLSFADYAEVLTQNGFDIVRYENCTKHAQFGYDTLGDMASEQGRIENDGQPLSVHYKESAASMERGEIGMVIIVARKR